MLALLRQSRNTTQLAYQARFYAKDTSLFVAEQKNAKDLVMKVVQGNVAQLSAAIENASKVPLPNDGSAAQLKPFIAAVDKSFSTAGVKTDLEEAQDELKDVIAQSGGDVGSVLQHYQDDVDNSSLSLLQAKLSGNLAKMTKEQKTAALGVVKQVASDSGYDVTNLEAFKLQVAQQWLQNAQQAQEARALNYAKKVGLENPQSIKGILPDNRQQYAWMQPARAQGALLFMSLASVLK